MIVAQAVFQMLQLAVIAAPSRRALAPDPARRTGRTAKPLAHRLPPPLVRTPPSGPARPFLEFTARDTAPRPGTCRPRQADTHAGCAGSAASCRSRRLPSPTVPSSWWARFIQKVKPPWRTIFEKMVHKTNIVPHGVDSAVALAHAAPPRRRAGRCDRCAAAAAHGTGGSPAAWARADA